MTSTVGFNNISDGSSNTMMLGEKLVSVAFYQGGVEADDRGWSDGWDYDTVRTTCFEPLQDSDPRITADPGRYVDFPREFGSAHPGVMNAVTPTRRCTRSTLTST